MSASIISCNSAHQHEHDRSWSLGSSLVPSKSKHKPLATLPPPPPHGTWNSPLLPFSYHTRRNTRAHAQIRTCSVPSPHYSCPRSNNTTMTVTMTISTTTAAPSKPSVPPVSTTVRPYCTTSPRPSPTTTSKNTMVRRETSVWGWTVVRTGGTVGFDGAAIVIDMVMVTVIVVSLDRGQE